MESQQVDEKPDILLPPSCSNLHHGRITTTQLGPIHGWIVDVPWGIEFMTGSSPEEVAEKVWDEWTRYSGITREEYIRAFSKGVS